MVFISIDNEVKRIIVTFLNLGIVERLPLLLSFLFVLDVVVGTCLLSSQDAPGTQNILLVQSNKPVFNHSGSNVGVVFFLAHHVKGVVLNVRDNLDVFVVLEVHDSVRGLTVVNESLHSDLSVFQMVRPVDILRGILDILDVVELVKLQPRG